MDRARRLRALAALSTAAALAAVSTAVALRGVRADAVPCRRIERVAASAGAPRDALALPVDARPGPVRDLDGAVPGAYRFERDVGDFRMRYALDPGAPRWGIDRATLSDARACDASGVDVAVPTPSSDVVLRRAPDGVYVLTGDAPRPAMNVAFRSVLAGSRRVWSGRAPCALALGALVALAAAWLMARAARRGAARVAAWREGLVVAPGAVIPLEGGASLVAPAARYAEGTRVLFSPPRDASPYRGARAEVDVLACTRASFDAARARRARRITALVGVSMAASAAALALGARAQLPGVRYFSGFALNFPSQSPQQK